MSAPSRSGHVGSQSPRGVVGPRGFSGPKGSDGPRGSAGQRGVEIKGEFWDFETCKAIYIGGKNVSDEDFRPLVTNLKHFKCLERIQAHQNSVSDSCARELLEAMRLNVATVTLHYVDLSKNPGISDAVLREIFDLCQQNKSDPALRRTEVAAFTSGKYELLMSSEPSADFDCGGLYFAPRLLDVIAHGACQINSTASVLRLDISNGALTREIASKLQQHLKCFSSVQSLSMSGNFELGHAGVTIVLSSFRTDIIQSLDVSKCGLVLLPGSVIERLHCLQDIRCVAEASESEKSDDTRPKSQSRGGIDRIKKFFFFPELEDLECVAAAATQLLQATKNVAVLIGMIKAILLQDHKETPLMAQQLWVSIVSHSKSNEFMPDVEKFLDECVENIAEIMKWKDHRHRSADAVALPFCKLAMATRAYFLGVYNIPDDLQYKYKSATCTVYLVDCLDAGEIRKVALKFMRNAAEFEREKSSREILLGPMCSPEQNTQHFIVESIENYHWTDNALQKALHNIKQRKDLLDYENPCLLVMPAASDNMRSIMDNERITKPEIIKGIFHEILQCVKFMHERGYIHGDVKPRNLVRILNVLQLIDFDASAQIGRQYSWSKHSSAYMPPEAIRVTQSVKCTDFAVGDPSAFAQLSVGFKVALPFHIASGCAFTISMSPVNITAVHSITLDDTIDLSSCVSVKDHVLTMYAKIAIGAGDRHFKVKATFVGSPPAAASISACLQHDVNTLSHASGFSKGSLAKCSVAIRNPLKDAVSMQSRDQPAASKSEVPSRPPQPPPPVRQSSTSAANLATPCPPYLLESAIASISLSLPPLQVDSVHPAVAKAVASMRDVFAHTATSTQLSLRALRQAWDTFQQIRAGTEVMRQPPQSLPTGGSALSRDRETDSAYRSSSEQDSSATQAFASSLPLKHAADNHAVDVTCLCTCDIIVPSGMRSGNASGCTGLCGIANASHDMWALGVLLYALAARESLWSEDLEDNIKDGLGQLIELAMWTDEYKEQRLLKIDDTATRKVVSKLLEKEPWKRPMCIDDVLAMPFNELDVIKLKLQQTVPHDASTSSNLVGSVQDLRTGKFSDAAYGLRSYLKVAHDWDEQAACTLQGMQEEVDLLKDCPDCARVQVDVLKRLKRSEADATLELQKLLVNLKAQRSDGTKTLAAATAEKVKALRSRIAAAEGWHYGMPNSIKWEDADVQVNYGTFIKVFSQPMCGACKTYNLDYSSIFADLRYITAEAAVEKKEWNGIRDHKRAGRRLQDFMELPQAKSAKLEIAELAALRFYTSHSFNSINIPMRDMKRSAPHPLPGMVSNIQRGLKKLRALGSDDASSKQTVVLWRGMSCMQLPQEFKNEGGTELAPMSTTTDVSVAISYAVKKDTHSAMLFRFVTRNNLERGADVQWLSMFPGESETLFPPLTFLQRTRTEPQEVVHCGVTVTVVELSTTLA